MQYKRETLERDLDEERRRYENRLPAQYCLKLTELTTTSTVNVTFFECMYTYQDLHSQSTHERS